PGCAADRTSAKDSRRLTAEASRNAVPLSAYAKVICPDNSCPDNICSGGSSFRGFVMQVAMHALVGNPVFPKEVGRTVVQSASFCDTSFLLPRGAAACSGCYAGCYARCYAGCLLHACITNSLVRSARFVPLDKLASIVFVI